MRLSFREATFVFGNLGFLSLEKGIILAVNKNHILKFRIRPPGKGTVFKNHGVYLGWHGHCREAAAGAGDQGSVSKYSPPLNCFLLEPSYGKMCGDPYYMHIESVYTSYGKCVGLHIESCLWKL